MMRLRASLNFLDKECLCTLEVCLRKLLHSDDSKPGNGQPFCGTSSFRGVCTWQGESPFRKQVGRNSLLPPVKLQMNTVGRESLQSCNTRN